MKENMQSACLTYFNSANQKHPFWRQFRILFMLVVIIFFVPSCGKKVNYTDENDDDSVLLTLIKEQDVPVPVGFIPTQEQCEPESKALKSISYAGSLEKNQAVKFYKKAMELNGWEIHDFSTKENCLLFCNKTNKSCAISIKSLEKQKPSNKTHLHVLLKNNSLSAFKNNAAGIPHFDSNNYSEHLAKRSSTLHEGVSPSTNDGSNIRVNGTHLIRGITSHEGTTFHDGMPIDDKKIFYDRINDKKINTLVDLIHLS